MAEKKVMIELGSKLSPGAKRAMERMRQGIQKIGMMAKKALNFGKFLAAGAAAAATSLALLVKQSIRVGDSLDKMSKRTNLSAEFLVGLGHAAEMGGNSISDMEPAIRKLSQAAADANEGLKTYSRQFDALGVSVTDAEGNLKPVEELFLETVDSLSKLENSTLKVSVASKIFGRAGTRLLPMLQEGKNGIIAMMEESKRLGNVWNDETTKSAADATDAMARVWTIGENMRDMLAVELIPLVTEAADATRDWFLANREIIEQDLIGFANSLKDSIAGAYEKIVQWQDAGEFIKWWDRVKLAADGVLLVITSINSGIAKLVDTAAKVPELIPGLGPLISLAESAGVVDLSGVRQATTDYRLSAEAAQAAALSRFEASAGEAGESTFRTDQYYQRGANNADAMQQAADAAVGAYQAGQEQRALENAARQRAIGA